MITQFTWSGDLFELKIHDGVIFWRRSRLTEPWQAINDPINESFRCALLDAVNNAAADGQLAAGTAPNAELVWINARGASPSQEAAAVRSAWGQFTDGTPDGTSGGGRLVVREKRVPGADFTPLLAVPAELAPGFIREVRDYD